MVTRFLIGLIHMEPSSANKPNELSRMVKISVTAVLLSLFVFNFYWTFDGYRILSDYLAGVPEILQYVNRGGLTYWTAQVGLNARFIAVALSLVAVFLLWVKGRSFAKVKVFIAAALALESVYFLGFFPAAIMLMKTRFIEGISGPELQAFFLGASYLLQAIIVTPLFLVLAFKIYRAGGSLQKQDVCRWAGMALAGYVAALAVNAVFRWLDMVGLMGLPFLLEGIRAVGFLDAVFLMPLAVIFAIVGAYKLSRQRGRSAIPWFGLALATVGLSYTVYVIYSYAVNALKFALLVDVWTIPFLGLGLALLFHARRTRKTE